jgi:mitochondrial division protein 1
LDFSEPYGTLVSASQEDAQPRVWDLFSGTEIGRLRGHRGTVKCVQVEDHVCLTGGEDGNVRLWDLRRVDEEEIDAWREDLVSLGDVEEEDEGDRESELSHKPNGIRDDKESEVSKDDPCARLLDGHTKAVTALYFEDECLVSTPSRTIFCSSIEFQGDGRVGQDFAPMGSDYRAMRDDNGYSVGNISST